MNPNKALVIFSGGQDSTTCLFYAIKKYDEVIAVSFDYNQKHHLELKCAQAICKNLNIEHHILDLSLLNQLAPNSLTRKEIEVDQNHDRDHDDSPPNSLVEGRNLLFLTYAAIIAKQKDISVLITGVSQSDFSGYPDCRHVFIQSTATTLNLAMEYPFEIVTPLMWLNKEETWALAHELGCLETIKNETLTCYNGIIGEGCGNCPACHLRKKGYDAFTSKQNR